MVVYNCNYHAIAMNCHWITEVASWNLFFFSLSCSVLLIDGFCSLPFKNFYHVFKALLVFILMCLHLASNSLEGVFEILYAGIWVLNLCNVFRKCVWCVITCVSCFCKEVLLCISDYNVNVVTLVFWRIMLTSVSEVLLWFIRYLEAGKKEL